MQLVLICVTFHVYIDSYKLIDLYWNMHMIKNLLKNTFKFDKRWWVGSVLLILIATFIFFGLHPHYRFVGIIVMLIACSLLFFRSIWPWITCLVFLAFTAFLWILGPSGYKFASLIPILVIILIISICYLKNPIKRLIILAVSVFSLILSIIEIPIVLSSENDAKPEMKYIIVLGAAVYGKDPSISLRNRMDAAISYLRKNPDTKAIVSGGQGKGEDISEAECMYQYMIHKGIEKDRIIIEDKSTSTMENLAYSKNFLNEKYSEEIIGIVSSSYHLYRAKYMAESIGLKVCGIPCEDGYPIYMIGMYIREGFAAIKLWSIGTFERDSCIASANMIIR